jgi:EAL domain-containing protein (putative c-di-GMP-specific phosphodiesterase class I)
MRAEAPSQRLTIEIHEAAVTSPEQMRVLRKLLNELDMSVAYDDFGAGQARLQEIAAAPPDYLKFDMAMIRGLDESTLGRQHLVRSLVELVNSLGICAVAEGVESEAEHEVCRELGFQLAQGYLYGRPSALPPSLDRGLPVAPAQDHLA